MMPFSWDEVQIFTFFHVMVRVTSILFFLPILGDKVIPVNVKILFGLALSFVIHPIAWAMGLRIDMDVVNSPVRLTGSIMGEIGFGVLTGFVARWVFDAVQFAGSFIGTSMGFSMASVMDPHTETQTTAISELQYILAAMLFLALDGHHFYLTAILDSFKILPFAGTKIFSMSQGLAEYLISMTAEVMALGLKLSAPVLIVIMIINMTFGVLARAVPQMNVLVVSFAANIFAGFIVVILSTPTFLTAVNSAFEAYSPEIIRFMKLMGQ